MLLPAAPEALRDRGAALVAGTRQGVERAAACFEVVANPEHVVLGHPLRVELTTVDLGEEHVVGVRDLEAEVSGDHDVRSVRSRVRRRIGFGEGHVAL